MNPIRHYALVQEFTPEECVKVVSAGIQKGFQPVGGVAVSREPGTQSKPGRFVYVQAMVLLWQPGEHPGIVVNGHGIAP